MNKNEFLEFVRENFYVEGATLRLISNILDYVEGLSKCEHYNVLTSLLDNTIGLTDMEIKNVYF